LLITGGHIIDPSCGLAALGNLLIAEGRIAHVGNDVMALSHQRLTVISAQGMVITPGFIDLHCHLREPGFEEKETIATGTRAAARGGFTTVCCMPNTEPPADTRAVVEYIQNRARDEGLIRVLPIGCITRGRKGEELSEMDELARAGMVAFSDDGNTVENSRLMRQALDYSRSIGLFLIDHCQDTALTEGGVMNEGWVATRMGLIGIPAAGEEIVVARDLALAQLTEARIHIAHVSTEGSVELIRRAKEQGIQVTAEVTPHHLTLTEERVMGPEWGMGREAPSGRYPLSPASYDTNAKVYPPLRTQRDVKALIQGLKEGVIDAIATDHAPHTLTDKMCEFDLAPFGISGLETALGCLMSLVQDGELNLTTLISKLTTEPAHILGRTHGELGTLKVGAPADVTIFDPEGEWVVDSDAFASKGKNNPWLECQLKGKVMATIYDGEIVYKEDSLKVQIKDIP
jgi:dihydroorotase